MDWALLGTAIALLGSSIFSGIASKRAQRRQNAYNDEAADKAMEQQQSLIDAQNQYNSPANQMSLLSDAGLNPLLAYNSLGSSVQQSSGEPHVASHDYIKSTEDTIAAVDKIAQTLMQAEQLRKLKLQNDLSSYKLDEENPLRLQLLQGDIDWLHEKVGLSQEQLSRLKATHDYYVDDWLYKGQYDHARAQIENIKRGEAEWLYSYNDVPYVQLKYDIAKTQADSAKYMFDLQKQYAEDERESRIARGRLLAKFYNGNVTWDDALHFMLGEILGNFAPTIFGSPLKFNMPTFNNNSEHFSTYQQNNNSTQTHQHVHQHTGSTTNTTNYAGDNNTRNSYNNKYKGKNTWKTNRK